MQNLIFIQLLNEKTESGYRQIYEAYATRLFGFILPVLKSKSIAEELVSNTFTTLWDESPVLSLRHPDPFLYLLQKMVMQLMAQGYATETTRQNIVNRVKSLRRESQLTVVTPHASKHSQFSGEFMPRPSA